MVHIEADEEEKNSAGDKEGVNHQSWSKWAKDDLEEGKYQIQLKIEDENM